MNVLPDTALLLIINVALSASLWFELKASEKAISSKVASLSLSTEIRLIHQEEKLSILERQLELYREDFNNKLSELLEQLIN